MLNIVRILFPFLLLWSPLTLSQSDAQQEELRKLAWQKGPTEARVGDKASIKVPSGYVFLDASNTRRFLELSGNPPRDGRYLFAPDSLNWFSIFSFDPSGFVKDDEKIDAEALLKTLKEGDGPGNDERKRLGMPPLYIDGWQVPPHYDSATKRLEWGTRIRTDQGEMLVNYTSRLLGRSGVMSAVLVSDPKNLAADTQEFRTSLRDFSYVAGEKYDEFKPGDKIAEYGLAALIVGGAAALATKKGFWGAIAAFFAAFWKVIAALGVAALAGVAKFFKKKS